MTKFKVVLYFCLLINSITPGFCLELPSVFSDHMVLQQGKPIRIWGKAEPKQVVKVSYANQLKISKANKYGEWQVVLDAMEGGYQAYKLVITTSNNQLTLKDILIGEVWLAAGQSNMRFEVAKTIDANSELSKSSNNSIRLLDYNGDDLYPDDVIFDIDKLSKLNSENYLHTEGWKLSTQKNNASFSAVAFYFAAKLQKQLDVPVGVINVSVGGTMTENFISKSTLASTPELSPLAEHWLTHIMPWCKERALLNLSAWIEHFPEKPLPHHPYEPGFMFDSGIKPLSPFQIKGVIWYQGESNAPITENQRLDSYFSKELNKIKLKTMVKEWRQIWQEPSLPFNIVQLPGMNRPWAEYRQLQSEISNELSNVSLVVSYDQGDAADVHPKRKRILSERIARLTLYKIYAKKQHYIDTNIHRVDFRNKQVVMSLTDPIFINKQLSNSIIGVEIGDENGKFYRAQARLNGNSLVVWNEHVSEPKAVRYAWFDDPKDKANLVTKLSDPIAPFLYFKHLK
ncbi:hypothetical protein H5123_03520 [Shewanella sp. SR43-4]|uniref:sialate O-acetylesterase n=1 Tax=Shewanella sp. SR43-4 TaxID=2760942 RepID=UPI0015FDE633|nr:sialate O-acetylesterase [Shewanella sp. SR43-4]MBB1316716.1 hypothetical protein [Shewanella sp. SR43-4]